MVSAEINIAKSVEILNLSGNDITSIENHNFKDFVDLINLSLAKNSIHTIELFAFASMRKLKQLDLSENRLESVDNRIIENNEKLTFLDFSKNKFMMLEDEPFLIADSLEFLSLRSSHISHIHDTMFVDMPKLIDLDISDNLLITLRSAIFFPLQKLQFLNIEYNRFTCDNSLEQTIQSLKLRKVFVKVDKCNKHSKKVMFEKMIMLPSPKEESKEDVEIELVWGQLPKIPGMSNTTYIKDFYSTRQRIEEFYTELKSNREEEDDCLHDEFTSSLCECRQNFISLYEIQEIKIKSIEYRLYAVLYVGLFLGAISGCFLFYIIDIAKKKCGNALTVQMKRQELRDRITRDHFEDVRRRRQNGTFDQPPVSNVQNIQEFSRPVNESSQRRQSYEALIEEPSATAQLINRLFRDRNAVEMHRISPMTARRELNQQPLSINSVPTAPLIEVIQPENIDGRLNELSNMLETLDVDNISEYASAVSQTSTLNIDRSCTPPPAYMEIFD